MTRARAALLLVLVALLATVAGVVVRNLALEHRYPAVGGRQPPARIGFQDTLARTSFPDLAGQTQPFEQWRGKVLVVNFWATWCPPCLKEIPEFIRMQTRYGDRGLQFVGVAVEPMENVVPFAAKMGFNYPVLIGGLDAVELLRALGDTHGGLPFTVVFDRSGTLAGSQLGGTDEAKLSRVIEPLL